MNNPSTSHGAASRISPPHGIFLAIFALAFGGLFIGTGEFASMSLLPELAHATAVSIPTAGAYISAYALGVVIGAPVLAVLAAKNSRKVTLIALLLLFVIGYAASTIAWNHWSLIAARFIAGLPHGAYYGVASLVAASMVDDRKRTQYIGLVMLGLAGANVIGVPLATWFGQALGWRESFLAMATGGGLTVIMIWRYIPHVPADKSVSPMSELRALTSLRVWLTLAIAAIGFGGMFSIYSYITPTLVNVTGFAASSVPSVLAVWGIGMVIGNIVGGWLADKSLSKAIVGMLIWNMVTLGAFAFVASSKGLTLLTLFLIGNGFALVPALQARLMSVAGKAQTLAASLNHSAFNTSNAIGAALGGMSIAAGFGWESTGFVATGLASVGLVLMLIAVWADRRYFK